MTPTKYRDYLVYDAPASYKPSWARFEWRHKDFDMDDRRHGLSATLDEAKAEIDAQIDENKSTFIGNGY